MSNVDDFLSRLEKVREIGRDRWVACCPAHDDKHPSLGIALGDDGRTLVVCRAGCDVYSIVSAVGMELTDLFPEKPVEVERVPPFALRFNARQVLITIAHEVCIVGVCAGDVHAGKVLSEADHNRLGLAISRILQAVDMTDGKA